MVNGRQARFACQIASLMASATFLQPITQKRIELRHRVDLFRRLLERIWHAAELDQVVVQQDITGSRVAISGLTDAADIDHQLRVRKRIATSDFVGRKESAVFGEHAGNVSMPLKRKAINQREQPLQLLRIVRILGKDVFAERVTY